MAKIICKVCGAAYSYCPDCVRDLDKPRWMVSFDKKECKDLFDVLARNSFGKTSDAEAIEKINAYPYEIKGSGILAHVERLKNVPSNSVQEVKEEPVVTMPEKKDQENSVSTLLDPEPVSGMDTEEPAPIQTSLFGNDASFTSNMKNESRAKEAAESIGSAINELNRHDDLEFVSI